MGNCSSDTSPNSDCGSKSYEGFLQPWIINYWLWNASSGKQIQCVAYGLWGLLFGNDDGILIKQCLNTGLVGGHANYYN